MEPPIQPKRIIQVSEQVFNPVRIPLIFNNQVFLMVQQDVRWIEETRHISYKKLTPEGQCFPNEFNAFSQNLPLQSTVHQSGVSRISSPPMDWTVQSPVLFSESTSTSDLSILNNSCSQSEHCIKLTVENETSCKSCLVKEVSCSDRILLKDENDELSAKEKIKLNKINDWSSV
ncbi:Mst89B family protein [Megaselia abdita]